jgi:hypothetical protein
VLAPFFVKTMKIYKTREHMTMLSFDKVTTQIGLKKQIEIKINQGFN